MSSAPVLACGKEDPLEFLDVFALPDICPFVQNLPSLLILHQNT